MHKPRMLLSLAACVALFVAAAAAESPGTAIKGVVRNDQGGRLPGATVTLVGKDGTKTTRSGACGAFSFSDVMQGKYKIGVELSGYEMKKEVNVKVEKSSTGSLTVDAPLKALPTKTTPGQSAMAIAFAEMFKNLTPAAAGKAGEALRNAGPHGEALLEAQETEFSKAVGAGDLPAVQRLLEDQPAFLNERDDRTGSTPLHVAVLNGRRGIAEFLLAQGADTTIVNCEGETPRQLAQRSGKSDLLEILK